MSDAGTQSRQVQPEQQEHTEEPRQERLQGQPERQDLLKDSEQETQQEQLEKPKPQDAFDTVLYDMAEQTRRQFEADMAGLKAQSDADRIKARLRCEEDCQIMAEILRIRNDNDIASFTTSTLASFKKQQDARRHKATISLMVLAVLMLTGTVAAFIISFSSIFQAICILFSEAICAGFAFLLLRHVMGTKDSNVNIAQVLETLAAMRDTSEKNVGGSSKEEALLELAKKLYPDNS